MFSQLSKSQVYYKKAFQRASKKWKIKPQNFNTPRLCSRGYNLQCVKQLSEKDTIIIKKTLFSLIWRYELINIHNNSDNKMQICLAWFPDKPGSQSFTITFTFKLATRTHTHIKLTGYSFFRSSSVPVVFTASAAIICKSKSTPVTCHFSCCKVEKKTHKKKPAQEYVITKTSIGNLNMIPMQTKRILLYTNANSNVTVANFNLNLTFVRYGPGQTE
jgi:hypothetical protein